MRYIPVRKSYPEEYCGWKQFTSESDDRINIKQNGEKCDMNQNSTRLIPVRDDFQTRVFGGPLFNFILMILVPLLYSFYQRAKPIK